MNDFTRIDLQNDDTLQGSDKRGGEFYMASAVGRILMSEECFHMVRSGAIKKGDVPAMARAAGIMGAKRASEIIPMCPFLRLEWVEIDFSFDAENCSIETRCTVKTAEGSGADMEALSGVNAALLTVYDMCRSVDRGMVIEDVRLLRLSDRVRESRQDEAARTGSCGTEPERSELKLWGDGKGTKAKERTDDGDGLSLWDM